MTDRILIGRLRSSANCYWESAKNILRLFYSRFSILALFSPSSSGAFFAFKMTSSASSPNVLECRVCNHVYGLQGDRLPRLLLCGHSLCHACLVRLQSEGAVKCPFDRHETPLGENGVWALKKNFALVELLEFNNVTSMTSTSLASMTSNEHEIDCDENEEHEKAVVYCTTCATHLCAVCAEATHATRTLAKHRRIPVEDKPKERPKCPHHAAQIVEFACLEVECGRSALMCYVCKDYGRHKGHKHNLLDLEATEVRETILNASARLRKFMQDVTDATRTLEAAETRLETNAAEEESKNRVRGYFAGLREELYRQETAALTVVDAFVRERLCAVRQQCEDLNAVLAQIAAVSVHCDRVRKQDDARVVTAASEVKAMLEAVECQREQFKDISLSEVEQIPITFTKDNRVHIGPKIEMRVVTLGLDGAGKTSILFKLKQNEFVPTIPPTIGFNVETLEYRNIKFTLWDVGGQQKLRPLWKHYYLNTQAVIFVVDSTSRDRLAEAKNELVKLLAEKELKDACILILCSKQDAENAMPIEELSNELSLQKLCSGKSYHVQGCDARSGNGLAESLDWLARQLVASVDRC